MLEKFIPFPLAWRSRRSGDPDPEQPRIDVIRHRLRSRFHGHGRNLLAVAGAVAVLSAGALAANAAVTGGDPAPAGVAAPAADESALAEREEAAGRADRGERPAGKPGSSQAAEPKESPKPEPKPEPRSKPESKSEPESKPKSESKPASESKPRPDWLHPMPGASTTSCFGWRWGAMHAGVDLAAPAGTPIRAAGDGTVTDAGWVFGGYGISVVIDHHNGFLTHYGHASEATVSVGEQVTSGQTIALEGSTGDSTGPHLHFEVHNGFWNQIEPTGWMGDRGVSIGGC